MILTRRWKLPVLDHLAAEGVVFDRAYHMGAWAGVVCTPSRHVIMSGRTVWHIQGKGNPHTGKPLVLGHFSLGPKLKSIPISAVYRVS